MLRRFCLLLLVLNSISLKSQYTDQINSNRPGASIGAFAVGKNVIQFESGVEYRSYKHSGYNSSTFNSGNAFLSIRWGFLFEQLELTYEGVYGFGSLNSKITSPRLVTWIRFSSMPAQTYYLNRNYLFKRNLDEINNVKKL